MLWRALRSGLPRRHGFAAYSTAAPQEGSYGEEGSEERTASKRELIDTGKNKMFAKRTAKGRFKEMDDVSRSLSADRRRNGKKTTKSGSEIKEIGSGRRSDRSRQRLRRDGRDTDSKTARRFRGSWKAKQPT